jgi:hypothetical protein
MAIAALSTGQNLPKIVGPKYSQKSEDKAAMLSFTRGLIKYLPASIIWQRASMKARLAPAQRQHRLDTALRMADNAPSNLLVRYFRQLYLLDKLYTEVKNKFEDSKTSLNKPIGSLQIDLENIVDLNFLMVHQLQHCVLGSIEHGLSYHIDLKHWDRQAIKWGVGKIQGSSDGNFKKAKIVMDELDFTCINLLLSSFKLFLRDYKVTSYDHSYILCLLERYYSLPKDLQTADCKYEPYKMFASLYLDGTERRHREFQAQTLAYKLKGSLYLAGFLQELEDRKYITYVVTQLKREFEEFCTKYNIHMIDIFEFSLFDLNTIRSYSSIDFIPVFKQLYREPMKFPKEAEYVFSKEQILSNLHRKNGGRNTFDTYELNKVFEQHVKVDSS